MRSSLGENFMVIQFHNKKWSFELFSTKKMYCLVTLYEKTPPSNVEKNRYKKFKYGTKIRTKTNSFKTYLKRK